MFQKYLSEEVTNRIVPSSTFLEKYGEDWDLIFRISAKQKIDNLQIRGPTKFKNDRDVEYTIFLPYDKIKNDLQILKSALEYLFNGVFSVFESLEVSIEKLQVAKDELIETIINDQSMYK
jgi:hypothetical protein